MFEDGELPITQVVKLAANQLNQIRDYHHGLSALVERLIALQVELKDVIGEVDAIADAVHYDAQRIEWINERMSAGYKLLKKHNVKTTAELLELQSELEYKLQAVLNIDEAIATKKKDVEGIHEKALQQATVISGGRKAQVDLLVEKVNRLLAQVGMPNARINVAIKEVELNINGIDNIEFLFDANKSGRFEPIRKVASGGELSRLMLCIKSLVAQSIDLPTMIFDEIDTGISGEAAKQVGIIMKEMSVARQLLCITHQPQIAGKANAHFYVYKDANSESVKTNIRLLSHEERVNAIAQMLSGETPTAAALENAKEMILN